MALLFILFGFATLLSGCSDQVIQGHQITGASPIRHAQLFDAEVLSGTVQRCIIRSKLPDQRQPGSWIDDRNSALRAALETASVCCVNPQLTAVEDWMIGFSAYEATFSCK